MQIFGNRKVSRFVVAWAACLMTACFAQANDNPKSGTHNVTAQDLNQNLSTYMGKQVTLSGHIDRVLGSGAYVISDAAHSKDPMHRVLVFTSGASNSAMANSKQQAGTAAPQLKEGDMIQLTGKAEQFSVSNEVDTFSPKSETENIKETAEAMPVIVVQPSGIQKS